MWLPAVALASISLWITIPHHFATWLRTYGFKEDLSRWTQRLIVGPIVIFTLTILGAIYIPITFFIVNVLWDHQHSIMQQHGFARSRFTALTLSHDGSHVIAANEGGVLTIINLDSQQLLHRLTNSSGDILAAAVVPSRNIAVTGDHSGKIKIWDLTSGSVIHSEQATTRAVSALAVSPNNSIVATGDWDGTVSIWKFKDSGRVERIIQNDKAHQGVITRLVFGSDNETLASASRDHTASIFRYRESLDRLLSVQHRSPIYGIDIAPAGTTFATGGEDQIVSVWSTQTGEQLHVDIHAQPIYSVLFNVKTGELMTVNNQQELINHTPVTR